jgi:hypothetical protein
MEFDFPFEWFTISIMLLYPCLGFCMKHFDKKNCVLYSYSKTGCANFIICDKDGNIYLLQILVNFRTSIESATFPHHKHVAAIINNIERYRGDLKEKLHELFACKYKGNMSKRKMKFLSDPFDMTDFFLDDHVEYQKDAIGSFQGTTICKEVLKLPIGISRTMSLSTMISALHMHRDWLHFDQGIEMCLMGCLLNTGARFHHIFSSMSVSKLEQMENEKHRNHPFLDYLDESMRAFGNWLGGKDGRFSVTGMSDVYL